MKSKNSEPEASHGNDHALKLKPLSAGFLKGRVWSRGLQLFGVLVGAVLAAESHAADPELTNYKSGIDLHFGNSASTATDKGVKYQEEYLYHDKLVNDTKSVWIRSDTPISFGHNARNVGTVTGRPKSVIGANGGGQVRYKIDKIWQELHWAHPTLPKYPAYTAPFTLASQNYESGVPVVGTTGGNGVTPTSSSSFYWRGMVDSAGDEWHVLAYADDDQALGSIYDDSWSSDGKYVLLCVNPTTPAMTLRTGGTGQFYTTPAWTYWTHKIHDQTTYFQGTCTFELKNIYGGNISYKINGGSTVNVGAATVTLSEASFSNGSNTLEYWYTSTPSAVRTRTVVENPKHPGLGENHGNRIWGDDAWSAFKGRITRAPYSAVLTAAQGAGGSGSGQTNWDEKGGQALRFGGSNWPHSGGPAGSNAITAKHLGWTAVRAGASKSYAAYAKEMMLESILNQSPLGIENSFWASWSMPCADTVYRGYWDVNPVYSVARAYDVLMGGYRSDQVSGGITPIEDYFMRDALASWVHLSALQIGGFSEQFIGMWGTCRNIGAMMITCVMPSYSTSYYGTSGMDGNTNVHQWAPYKTHNYTWKDMFLDLDNGLHAFTEGPYQTFGMEGPSSGKWLIREPSAAQAWIDKTSYASYGQCGHNITTYANLIATHSNFSGHANLLNFIDQITEGTLKGGKGDVNAPYRLHMIDLLHGNFPVAAANAGPWVRGLPATDDNSDDKAIIAAGYDGVLFYDDTYGGGAATPTVATPLITPGSSFGNVAAVSVTITCATNGATIRYTTNGSDPTSGSTVYSGPVSVATTTTVKARAFLSGYNDSGIAANTYSFGMAQLTVPTFSSGTGTFTDQVSVTINFDPNSTTRRYRINGGAWTLYTAPLAITNTGTVLEAYSMASGYAESAIASATYTIKARPPGISPAGGVFLAPVTWSVTANAAGGTTHVTVDGSEPDGTDSTILTGVASSTATIRARTIGVPGKADSDIVGQLFQIGQTDGSTGDAVVEDPPSKPKGLRILSANPQP